MKPAATPWSDCITRLKSVGRAHKYEHRPEAGDLEIQKGWVTPLQGCLLGTRRRPSCLPQGKFQREALKGRGEEVLTVFHQSSEALPQP